MARFSKRTQENDDDNVTAVPAIDPDEVLLPGEEPEESAESETAPESADVAHSDSNTIPQEESEMTDTVVEESVPAERHTYVDENGTTLVATDAAERLLAEVEGETVTMLEIGSLPNDARILKMQLEILKDLADEYKVLRKELADGTSGKDEKIAAFLAENEEIFAEIEGKNVDLKNALAEAQEARDAAIAAANKAEADLLAHVEAELSKTAGGVMSEEDIAAKTAEIKTKYGEYAEQHKAAKSFLDNYRAHKNPEVGEINQYVTHIDRPSGRPTSGGGGTRNASDGGAGRSVHVSGAFFSRDGGQTWEHSTTKKNTPKGTITLSNPASLAVDLGQAFSTTVSKDDIIDAWYSACGKTREGDTMATKANMPAEKVFEMAFKDGSGNEVKPLVKLVKRQ